jgi:MFS family permease
MGLYATFLSIGFAIGPAILALAGSNSIKPFLIGAVLMVLAAVPSLLARDVSPVFESKARHRFGIYIFAVPTATFGVFAFAIGESSGFAFLPLWGTHLGFGLGTAPLLASAMTLGNVMFQIPIGLMSDRLPRRLILLACGIVGALGLPLAWLISDSPALLVISLFVWGGATALHCRPGASWLTLFRSRSGKREFRTRFLLRAWDAARPSRRRRRNDPRADQWSSLRDRARVRPLFDDGRAAPCPTARCEEDPGRG